MRAIHKFLSLALVSLIAFSCIDEIGEIVRKGNVQLKINTPEAITVAEDFVVKIKLYREYNGVVVESKLGIESIAEDGTITTEAIAVEEGNWELQTASVLKEKDNTPVYVGVGKDDPRAEGIDVAFLLPQKNNILTDIPVVFEVTTVDFDPVDDVEASTKLFYDFSDGVKYDKITKNGWLTVDAKEGADRGWSYNEVDIDGVVNKYAQGSGYGGTDASYTSWMISPPLDVTNTINKQVAFKTAKAYWAASTEFKVYIMDGVDPSTANSTELTAVLASETDEDNAWIESGDIDLSAYSGVQYIAFYYKGDGAGANSTTFRVDDFTYGDVDGDDQGTESPAHSYLYEFVGENYAPVVGDGWTTLNKDSDPERQWSYTSYNDDYYAQATAKGAGLNTEIESWMVSPSLNIKDVVAKTVSFSTAKYGWQPATTTFEVYAADSNDPTTAKMAKLNFKVAGDSDADHAWVESGNIDLSSLVDWEELYIVFYYKGTDLDENCTFRVANFNFGDAKGEGGSIDGGVDIDLEPDVTYDFKENFDNNTIGNSYVDGSFTGNNGIEWTYVASRDENGDENGAGIDGNALMLRRLSDASKVTSSTISGGIKNFRVKLYKGFTGGGDRQAELFINGNSYGTSETFDDNNKHIWTIDDINVSGDVTIEIRNITEKQLIIDDIEWNSFE